MYIVSNSVNFECNSIEEYKHILTGKIGFCINYFSENNEEQYVSIGDQQCGGMEKFLGGQYEVERCQIISYEDAMECAMEFFKTQQRPDNIEWDAL